MLVRPETVAFGDDAEGRANQFLARPESRTYTGEVTEFIFAVEGENADVPVQVVYPGNVTTDGSGEAVRIGWDQASAVYFSDLSEGGQTTVGDLKRL